MDMMSCRVSASISLTLSRVTKSSVALRVISAAAWAGMPPTAAWALANAAST